MKKRQQIQKEIAELNVQLRQHQMEQRRQQQSKASSMDDMIGGKNRASSKNGQNSGLSQPAMKAMMSADTSIKQAQVQGSVVTKLEGRANVLKSEIKTDQGKGNTEAKEAELASLEQKAMTATAGQMDSLNDANRVMDEAAKAERESSKSEGESAKAERESGKAGSKSSKVGSESSVKNTDVNRKDVEGTSRQDADVWNTSAKDTGIPESEAEVPTENVSVSGGYVHVDVKL